MRRYIDKTDLEVINAILEKGEDVLITKTSYVVRIKSQMPHKVKEKEIASLKEYDKN